MDLKKISDSYEEFLSEIIIGIGEVLEITGIPIRKLRYWESKGIIKTIDEESGTRQFSLFEVKKALLILELIEDGYTLDGAAAKVEKRLSRIKNIMDMLSMT